MELAIAAILVVIAAVEIIVMVRTVGANAR